MNTPTSPFLRQQRGFMLGVAMLGLLLLTACGRHGAPALPETGERTVTITASLTDITADDPEFEVEGLPLEAASLTVTRVVEIQ